MDKGIYVAMTGASAMLQAQASIAHNLANVDTTGFKAALVQTQQFAVNGPGLPSRIDATLQSGGFDSTPGPQIITGNPLDVSLKPGAWLAVQDSSGQEAYTRAGNLHLTENGQLVTAANQPVLSENGPITLPPNQSANIGADGTISVVPSGQGPEVQANVGRIRIVQGDSSQLTRGVDGLMRRSDGTPATALAGSVLTPGATEGSNVNASDALVSMIELSRQYDLQIQELHNADDNARSANSMLSISG